MAQIASGECVTTATQDLLRAPQQITTTQDGLTAATTPSLTPPAQEYTSPTNAPLQNATQTACSEGTITVPQELPGAPEEIAVPQDGLPAVMTLAPALENTDPATSTTSVNVKQKLAERRYARMDKMRPGTGRTVRYVC